MHYLRLAATPFYLLFCLLLGGASAAGIWANMLLQLIAIPLILASTLTRPTTPIPTSGRHLLLLLFLMIALIAVQLVPLPASIWSTLPGRSDIARGYQALGGQLHWLTLSLSPYRSISSALWLLPPTAILLAMLRLRAFKPEWLAWVLAGVAVISVALGALQLAEGQDSGWYFYSVTNVGASVGFFANANHLATLLLCVFPFLVSLYLYKRAKSGSSHRISGLLVLLAGVGGIVIVGLVLNRSLAGLGLAVPVIAASALMIPWRGRHRLRLSLLALIPLLVLGSVVAALVAPFGNNLVGEAARASEESRFTSFSRSLDAAVDHFPVGSGIGTFQQIYRSREDPETISRFYMNHVHSDYIELVLETGAPGMILLTLFLLWWGVRAIAIWRAKDKDYFAMAGSISSAAILAHSAVDYPLRTVAISAIFALSIALMAEPRPAGRQRREKRGDGHHRQARHLGA
ncbi:MAG TPA: O-antigen ligase family protein [Chloroflexota bacterium]|nr:O-antigen ligase family protein [Chloroflexota bacterium]